MPRTVWSRTAIIRMIHTRQRAGSAVASSCRRGAPRSVLAAGLLRRIPGQGPAAGAGARAGGALQAPSPSPSPQLLQAGLAGCLTPPFMKTCCFPGFDLLA